jgi:hypothetical protein
VPTFRPGKPWRRLTLTADKAQSGALAAFPFDAAAEDGEWGVGSDHTTTVVEHSGLYLVCAHGIRAAGLNSTLTIGILINGAVTAANTADAANAVRYAGSSSARQLVAGDTIAMAVAGTSAAAKLTVAGTALEIVRIGPLRWT